MTYTVELDEVDLRFVCREGRILSAQKWVEVELGSRQDWVDCTHMIAINRSEWETRVESKRQQDIIERRENLDFDLSKEGMW